nr:hypothetical protein GCM10025699_41070 [Microbacterium flavescens]
MGVRRPLPLRVVRCQDALNDGASAARAGADAVAGRDQRRPHVHEAHPYLAFRDGAREALDFYRSVFGGDYTATTFGEFHMGGPHESEKIMHGQLVTADGILLMAADRPDDIPLESENSISLSLFGGADDADELIGYFEALAVGGAVSVPLEQAPWGDSFGMVDDRFGLHWMVNIAGAAATPDARSPRRVAAPHRVLRTAPRSVLRTAFRALHRPPLTAP